MTTINNSPKFLQHRKFLLWLPAIVLPFVWGVFYALGGGRGATTDPAKAAAGMGFNMELPKPLFTPKENNMTKMDYYKKADQDSIRRKAYLQQDPYHTRVQPAAVTRQGDGEGLNTVVRPTTDPKADQLLEKLEGLKKALEHPVQPKINTIPEVVKPDRLEAPLKTIRRPVDTAERDPQLERLNQMLDKIIRIQHGGRDSLPAVIASPTDSLPVAGVNAPPSNTFPAVVEGKQKLVAGATIALRLTDSALINGVRMDRDQLLYGVVSFHNDRMGVHIGSIRCNQSIYPVSLEVYDRDGLAGIHIRHLSGRQLAKESADQGVGSMTLASYDPSFSGQVANAGIQVARSLFHRRVRQERVKVKDGYPVLLLNTRKN